MTRPSITVDLDAIEHNARTVVAFCNDKGIDVVGVTKGVCGDPRIAEAMLRGGVSAIGESRMENIRRLRDAGVKAPFMLLRIPPLSEVENVVGEVDVSLNSELSVLEGLSEAAKRRGGVHDIVVMVDLGDLREGVWPDDLDDFIGEAIRFEGIRIVGLGTNLACLGGVIPTEDNMRRLVAHARALERHLGRPPRWISGVNSSGLELIASGKMPVEVNQARIGEAILLGRETTRRRAWPGTRQDAFLLRAEVLELKEKPSLPRGEIGQDAFGHRPVFDDLGDVMRAILNIGREDVEVEGLTPLDPHIGVIGASSDYVVADVGGADRRVRVGGRLSFALNYAALLAAMTSAYVEKRYLRAGPPATGGAG